VKIKTILFFSIFTAFFVPDISWARVDVSTDAAAQIEMNLRLEIPQRLYLRIGTPGSQIDTVRFNVTGLPQAQPKVEGDYHPIIEINSNMPSGCDLTADSTGGLRGPASIIPFTSISFEGTGAFTNVKGSFNGTADQKVYHISGKGKKQGTLNFFYNNTYAYPPGTYVGTVTFTLAAP
jgi:hypothetical protein